MGVTSSAACLESCRVPVSPSVSPSSKSRCVAAPIHVAKKNASQIDITPTSRMKLTKTVSRPSPTPSSSA